MVTAVRPCEHCAGAVVVHSDEWPRCAACGRDPDAPARPPTREEKRLSTNDSKVTHAFNFNSAARDARIIELHNAGVSAASLAERFGLSLTRVHTIVKN